MNNHQRGIYQPLAENIPVYELAEDGIEDEERSRLPLLIVMGLIVLAAFTGVVWLAYNQGVERGRSGTTFVIAPPEGPVRTAPDSAAASTPFTKLKIYNEPVPADQEAKVSNLAVTPATLPPPKPQAPPAALPPATTEAPPVRLNPPAPPQAARIAPPPPAIAPPPALAQTAPPARTAPAPQTAVAPATPAVAPPVVAAPAAPAAPKTAAMSGFVLQLGSYQNEMLAQNGWNTFKARYAEVASSLSQDVQQVDLGARGIWYRLRVGPFADRPAAVAACEKLKAQGGTCFVTAAP